MGATFSVVCLTPQRRLTECIMGNWSIFCSLRNYLFVLFVCYLIVIFVKKHVPRGVPIECRKKGHRKKEHRKNGHEEKGTGKMGTGKKGTSEKLGKKGTLQKKSDIM